MSIKQAEIRDSEEIAKVVATSNEDVAELFGLNRDNNPKHPSFYNNDWVLSDFDRGEIYFLYQVDGKNIGCVAFERPNNDLGYLNRLSVLPEHRNQGIGEALVKHVFHYARSDGVSEISIGIIANHTVLKNWYARLGFIENGIKKFSHLPFDVLFMKYDLKR